MEKYTAENFNTSLNNERSIRQKISKDISIHYSLLQNIEAEGALPNSFWKTPIPKPAKDIMREENYSPLSLMNIKANSSTKSTSKSNPTMYEKNYAQHNGNIQGYFECGNSISASTTLIGWRRKVIWSCQLIPRKHRWMCDKIQYAFKTKAFSGPGRRILPQFHKEHLQKTKTQIILCLFVRHRTLSP